MTGNLSAYRSPRRKSPSPQSLANVLNANVFDGKDAPLKDIVISIEKDRLKIKGKLHQKGDIGFETEGQLSATSDGKIRLHAEKIKALNISVKGMMDLFGLDIADLIKNGKVRGVQVEKDDLILDPGKILPPPTDFRPRHGHSPGGQQHCSGLWRSAEIRMDATSLPKTIWRIAATACNSEN